MANSIVEHIVELPGDIPEKRVAFHLPIRTHPTRLDGISKERIPEQSDSESQEWDVLYQHEQGTTSNLMHDKKVDIEDPSPNYQDYYKAIIRGDINAVKHQMHLGATVERETDDGFSPLVIAIMEEQVDMVKFLLDEGADVHHRIKKLPTLVHAAMKPGCGPQLMQLLLDHGAILYTVSSPDDKNVLHWAACEGLAESVEFLLDKGMDVETRCSRGRTPLILAAEAGYTQVAKVLSTHGANLDKQSDNGGTSLTWAACRNRPETLEFLLEQGINPDLRDKNGHTALSLACHFGHNNVVQLLLASGAEINIRSDEPKDCTPAMAAACSDSVDVLKTLIAHGADLSLRSSHGDNVLEVALIERKEGTVRAILEALGGVSYPKESVAIQIAMANSHEMIKGLMATASVMYSYMEVGLSDEFAWMQWMLRQGGELVKPLATTKMLHTALEERDLPMIEALVRHGCDVNRRLESGHTPLSFAVGHRELETIQVLLDAGADPNQTIPDKDGMNYTSFDHAIIDLEDGTDTEVVDILLKSGRCCINKGSDLKSTAFSFILNKSKAWAPGVGDSLAIRMVDSIANVNEDKDDIGCTLLHVAVHHEREDFVDLLLSRGADMEAAAHDGYTPFILACQCRPTMLSVLVDRGANVHARYKSDAGALHAAAAECNIEALELLFNLGMDIEDQTSKGYTPLACALTWAQEEAALCLLEEGASAHAHNKTDQTALHFAARHGLVQAVTEILKQDIDVNARDINGWTPLHEACATGSPTVISLLLDAGADIECPLRSGDTPLHVALINENRLVDDKNQDVASLLTERGANIFKLGSRGRTTLHLAMEFRMEHQAVLILEKGGASMVNIVDDDSWTPLCLCDSSMPSITKQLIKHGADVHYKDRDGWTPLHQAVHNGDSDNAKILINAGASLKDRTTDDGLTVMERALDMEQWGREGEKRVHPLLLRSYVAQTKCRQRKRKYFEGQKKRLEEQQEREEMEKALEGLGEKFELVEAIEE